MKSRTIAGMEGTGVVPLLSPAVRRARLMEWQEIGVVLDVGANTGQYAASVRAAGYRGRIVSFEPLRGAFDELVAVSATDALWQCHRTALGLSAAVQP